MANEADVISISNRLNLTYTLLPGHCPKDFPALHLHNEVFSFWTKFWDVTLHELSNESVPRADFSRQNAIGLVRIRDEIAGILLHSFFDLDNLSARALPYFQNYDELTLKGLREAGPRTVMTMEWLTVAPSFRKSNIGISLATLVIGLGFELFNASGYDAMIASARQDLKVDAMAAAYGARHMSRPYLLHHVPVVSIYTPREKLKRHDDPLIAALLHQLWRDRQDLIQPMNNSLVPPRLSIAT